MTRLCDRSAQVVPGLAEGGSAGAAGDAPAAAAAEHEPESAADPVEEEFDLADLMAEEIEDSGAGGTKAERLARIDAQLKVGSRFC